MTVRHRGRVARRQRAPTSAAPSQTAQGAGARLNPKRAAACACGDTPADTKSLGVNYIQRLPERERAVGER